MSRTTIRESIEDLADLAYSIRTKTHLTEQTVTRIIEMVLQKQISDRQLALQEAQLGYRQTPPEEETNNVIALVPDEVITGSDHPEEDA